MDWAAAVERASIPELILLRSLIDRRVYSRKTKRCSCCEVVKSVDAFSYHPNTRDRCQSHCKECRRKYRRRKYRVERGLPVQLALIQFEEHK
jgi:hypothetical protein